MAEITNKSAYINLATVASENDSTGSFMDPSGLHSTNPEAPAMVVMLLSGGGAGIWIAILRCSTGPNRLYTCTCKYVSDSETRGYKSIINYR